MVSLRQLRAERTWAIIFVTVEKSHQHPISAPLQLSTAASIRCFKGTVETGFRIVRLEAKDVLSPIAAGYVWTGAGYGLDSVRDLPRDAGAARAQGPASGE